MPEPDRASREAVLRFRDALAGLPLGTFALAGVHLVVLALGLHLFDQLAGWFWPIRERYLPYPELLAAVIPLPVLAAIPFTGRLRSTAGKVCFLVLLGYLIQHGLALLDGRGISGMSERMLASGHGEVLRIAADVPGLRDLVAHYDDYAASGALGTFARAKPPGFLLLYVATFRAGAFFAGGATVEGAARFASFVWPLFASLTLVPLHHLARRAMDERRALVVCTLYLLVPSVELIVLHADQAFFPLLVTSVVACAAASADRGRGDLAALAGAGAYLAGFCSFSLLLALPLAAAAMATSDRTGRELGGLLFRLSAGFVAAFVLMWLLLGYEPVARAASAFAFHAGWRPGFGGAPGRFYYALIDALELAVWVGVPIACLSIGDMGRALRRLLRGRESGRNVPSLVLAASLAFIFFFGAVKGESARLCCFLVPFLVLSAVSELGRRGRSFCAASVGVAVLEWATTLLTKVHQDFW
jgi:hypothetical protein